MMEILFWSKTNLYHKRTDSNITTKSVYLSILFYILNINRRPFSRLISKAYLKHLGFSL